MKRAQKIMTADEVKKKFAAEGRTYDSWAKEHGFTRTQVSQVINGFSPCKRGCMHQIAVLLGLKADPEKLA